MNFLSRQEVRDVDRRAIDEFGMTGLVLMENAGRGCVDVLCELGIHGPVIIACGKGNNGGDGFVIARHLELRGHIAKVILCCEPRELTGDAAANFAILMKCETQIVQFARIDLPTELIGADWIVDALLGTGTQGAPRPPLAQVIEQLNAHPAKKMAIDLPSGLDCDTGLPATPTFRADHTCTFVAAKLGFRESTAVSFLGHVHVLDIGAPAAILRGSSK